MFVVLAEKAFDEDGNLKQPKELSINKVGHGMAMLTIYCQLFHFSTNLSGLYLNKIVL